MSIRVPAQLLPDAIFQEIETTPGTIAVMTTGERLTRWDEDWQGSVLFVPSEVDYFELADS